MTVGNGTDETRMLPLFALQIADAYLYDSSVTRVPTLDAKPGDNPSAEIYAHSWHIQENDRVLVVVIGARASAPFREGQVLKVECTTAGHFRSEVPLTRESVADFAAGTALLLIYPYLRANVGELARMTGISVPSLPTLDAAGVLSALSGGGGEPATGRRRARRVAGSKAPVPTGDSTT